MSHTLLTPLVKSLPATVPFVGPEAQERASGQAFKARLGANENLFGPSPKARLALQAAAEDIWKYGDPEAYDLRRAIADHHGIPPENIGLGEGIDGLLGLAVRLFIAPAMARSPPPAPTPRSTIMFRGSAVSFTLSPTATTTKTPRS